MKRPEKLSSSSDNDTVMLENEETTTTTRARVAEKQIHSEQHELMAKETVLALSSACLSVPLPTSTTNTSTTTASTSTSANRHSDNLFIWSHISSSLLSSYITNGSAQSNQSVSVFNNLFKLDQLNHEFFFVKCNKKVLLTVHKKKLLFCQLRIRLYNLILRYNILDFCFNVILSFSRC